MKTLDEVIKAWSICFSDNSRSNCTGCPYADEDGEAACFNHDREDALHYLKEYQRDKDELDSTRLAYLDILTDYVALKNFWAEQQANPPLTWDELKNLKGKPVWIELLNHDMWDDPSHRVDSEWWVIGEVRKDDIILATYLDEMELCEEDIGVIWQAYRKERE